MSKYIHTLFVGISLLLFGTSVSFGDDASYRQPAGGDCWWVYNYDSVSWYIDCGALPEIEVVAAAPPPDEDIYHNVGNLGGILIFLETHIDGICHIRFGKRLLLRLCH